MMTWPASDDLESQLNTYYELGTTYTYECFDGYQMVDGGGNDIDTITVTCQPDTSWFLSAPIGTCECELHGL